MEWIATARIGDYRPTAAAKKQTTSLCLAVVQTNPVIHLFTGLFRSREILNADRYYTSSANQTALRPMTLTPQIGRSRQVYPGTNRACLK